MQSYKLHSKCGKRWGVSEYVSHLIPAGARVEADVVQLEVLHAERAFQGLVVRRGWVQHGHLGSEFRFRRTSLFQSDLNTILDRM